MKKYINYIIVFFFFPILLQGQTTDYAGPDKSACQGDGVTIGNASPGNVCYTWDMADGLNPNDIHNSNPHVRPQFNTTYTVHVVGSNFSFSATDQVKVSVSFGGLVITPSYINLSGPQMNQATATLTVNPSNNPVIWSIPTPGMTGCSIDQNGVISNCHATGTVTVKATNQNDPGCVAEKTLEINDGIKDVIVSDNANEGREAHKGQTLYLVGPVTGAFTGTANFTAVQNENSSFPSGQPTWSGPYMPPPGSEITWNTPPLNIGTYTETVGTIDPKSVTTEVIAANETSITVTVDTALIATLTRLLKGNAKVKEMDQFCSSPFNFAFPGAISVSYKESNVGKYKDPGYATKKDFQVEIPAIAGTGCMYFPCCTGGVGFGPVPVLYMTYVALTAGISVSGLATKDPSASANPQWMSSSFSITGTGRLDAGVRLEADFSTIAGFIVGANLSTEVKIEGRYVFTPPKFEWNGTWGGLVGKVSGTIWYGSIDNNIEVAFQKNLLPGAETGWSTLYQFP